MLLLIVVVAAGATAQESADIGTPSRYGIAVLDFSVTDLTGSVADPASLGRAMSVSFQTPLVQSRRFTVLTRDQLDAVLNELALNQQGIIDPDEAQRVGQLTGVEVIVTGTIIVTSPERLSVTANFIDVESGEVAAAITLAGSGPDDFARLARELVGGAAREFPPQGTVVAVEADQVYINLGNETGLSNADATGAIFRNSRIAGLTFSEQIGTFEVTQIGPQVSRVAVAMDDGEQVRVGDVVTIQSLDRLFLPSSAGTETPDPTVTDPATTDSITTNPVVTDPVTPDDPDTTGAVVGLPSGPFGTIPIGATRSATIAAKNDAANIAAVYHTYVVDVLPGTDSLDIRLSGNGDDVDLVIKAGSEIVSYRSREEGGDWDYLDFSTEPDPSYRYDDPPPGPLYIDVVNLLEQPLTYTLSVMAPVAAEPGLPSGSYGTLSPATPRTGRLAATDEANSVFAVYHTYTVEVPPGTASLDISVTGRGGDLDLAVKAGSEIMSYRAQDAGGDWDHIDFSNTPNPSYRYDNPPSGPVYIDVVNRDAVPQDYTLTVGLEPRTTPTPSGIIGAAPPGQTLSATLAGSATGVAYHTYTVEVPPSAPAALKLRRRHRPRPRRKVWLRNRELPRPRRRRRLGLPRSKCRHHHHHDHPRTPGRCINIKHHKRPR
ncbi:MAG: CsgG/HfaB family protein [Trueperaceae bacterium]|nr:CsgG/HfaB family protein [Trueperaceae bacterium]